MESESLAFTRAEEMCGSVLVYCDVDHQNDAVRLVETFRNAGVESLQLRIEQLLKIQGTAFTYNL
jgi:hypothetical protein